MPHISKQKVDKKILERIYTELVDNLSGKRRNNNRFAIFDELLTDTEKIMLAKRFAAICMLGRGFTFEEIQNHLGLSPSTVGRFWSAIERGEYDMTKARIKKSGKRKSIVDSVLSIITVPLRPVHGPRWKWLDEFKD